MNTITWYVATTDEEQAIAIGRYASACGPFFDASCHPFRKFVTNDEEEIAEVLAEARRENQTAKAFRVTFAEAASVIPDSCLK